MSRARCLTKARVAIALAYDFQLDGNDAAALTLLAAARRYIRQAQIARAEAA